jgi:hypothetical protein
MMESIPPRLRSPLIMLAGGAAIDAAVIPAFGWESLFSFVPVTIICAAAYYVWGGRDSDSAAMVRHQPDERQAYRQLKIQALLGRVMSVGVGIAYVAAVAAKVTLWPYAALLALFVVTLLAGWVIYREPGGGEEENPGHRVT